MLQRSIQRDSSVRIHRTLESLCACGGSQQASFASKDELAS